MTCSHGVSVVAMQRLSGETDTGETIADSILQLSLSLAQPSKHIQGANILDALAKAALLE